MIQRIQSLFLLGTVIFTGLMFFLPAASILAPDHCIYDFYTSKTMQAGNTPDLVALNWNTLILNAVVTLLAFITIFVRKRKSKTVRLSLLLQMRFCLVNFMLQAGLTGLVWVNIHRFAKDTGAEWSPNPSFIFPLVGMIFTGLAIRAITKDITLLKSFDRIR